MSGRRAGFCVWPQDEAKKEKSDVKRQKKYNNIRSIGLLVVGCDKQTPSFSTCPQDKQTTRPNNVKK